MLSPIPLWSTIVPQIQEYICHNYNDFIGVSIYGSLPMHRYHARKVNELYFDGFQEIDEFDFLATMRDMVEKGILIPSGMWGSKKLYTVAPEYRKD